MNNTLLLSVWRALRELPLKKGQHAYKQSEHPCKRACGLEYILARKMRHNARQSDNNREFGTI